MSLCNYGSEPKNPNDGIITVDLFADLNVQAIVILSVYGVDRNHQINIPSFCSVSAPTPVEFIAGDLLVPSELLSKVIQNKEAQAWYQYCQCKAAPPPPPPPDYTPPTTVTCPNPLSYPSEVSVGWSYDVIYEYRQNGVKKCERLSGNYGSNYRRNSNFTITIANGSTSVNIYNKDGYVTSFFGSSYSWDKVHYAVMWYKPFGDGKDDPEDDEKPPKDPDFPDWCICAGDSTDLSGVMQMLGEILLIVQTLLGDGLLKYSDFREGVADINLWTSESNSNQTQNINSNTNEKKEELRQQIAAFYQFYESNSARNYADTVNTIQSAYNSIEINADQRRNSILTRVTDTGNEIKLGITVATATITAAITVATATTTTAIAASTASITAAIGTATATTATNITTAIEGLKGWLTTKFDKIKTDNDKNFKDYNPKRLYVTVNITGKPDNLSQTAGRNGAPPIYYYGWIIFVSKEADSMDYYYPRIYINTMLSVIRCPAYGEKNDCVVHLATGVTAVTSKLFKVEKDG